MTEPTGRDVAIETAPERGWLAALYDPEWFTFLGVLLLPAIVELPLRDGRAALFFVGTALYLSVLKWLGRFFVTRHVDAPAPLLFPVDLFFGLAVVCLWFYLRNLAARFWPASYSLRELAVLSGFVVVAQLVGFIGLRGRRKDWRSGYGVYLAYAVLLLAAFWNVSRILHVLSTDPLIHAWLARCYYAEGIDVHPLPGQPAFPYPSGFGAINAVTMALTPLNAVQAVNLQHVLWMITALFLIPAGVRLLYPRTPGEAQLLPLLIASVLPIYCLKPDINYAGTPRQLAPALLLAVALLPTTLTFRRPSHWFGAIGLIAVLSMVALTLNPSSAPFLAVLIVIQLVANCREGRARFGISRWKSATAQAGLALLAAGLILCLDPYYGHRERANPATTATAPPQNQEPLFSPRRGAEAAWRLNPLELSPIVTMTHSAKYADDEILHPLTSWPELAFTWASLLLAVFATVTVFRKDGSTGLRWVLGIGWVMWLAGRPLVVFVAEGLSRTRWDTALLRIYLRFLQVRCDILLLFVFLVVGLSVLLVWMQQSPSLRRLRMILLPVLIALPILAFVFRIVSESDRIDTNLDKSRSRLKVPATNLWEVTDDDLKLVAWMDANLPPEKGEVGLEAVTFPSGPHGVEAHIYPVGGAIAPILYGKYRNFRFFDPVEHPGMDEQYRKNVRDVLNVDWCLANGIRYFYVTDKDPQVNPGLHAAIKSGALKLLHREGGSGIYEVVKESHAE